MIPYSVPQPGEEGEAKGPSKNELKKRAKEAEKLKKAMEKAARQAELEAQKAAAEVVRISWLVLTPLPNLHITRTLLLITMGRHPSINRRNDQTGSVPKSFP